MTALETVQMLSAQKPRVWRQATKEQRRNILATYEATQSVKEAFKALKAYRVTTADLFFVGDRRGGGR